jgi:hypothetical protein
MVIRYVGNFRETYCTETHLAKTLENLGHEVIRLQEDTTQDVVGKCDLFLFTRTWGNTVKMEHLQEYKKMKIPTVSWHLDLYVGLQRDGGIDNDPFWRTDFVFTPDGDPKSAEVFKEKGINHHYMKPGVFKDECYIPKIPTPDRHELIFVGSYNYHPEWPYRQQLIDFLKSTYPQFEHWGPEGRGLVRGDALNRLYANTKVVVGDSLCLGFDKPYYWSDRVYETLGRGGFLIHPYIEGMDEEFVDGVHLAYYKYGDFEELKAKIDYFLQADRVREDIRKIGHEFVKKHATYENRAKDVLDVVLG